MNETGLSGQVADGPRLLLPSLPAGEATLEQLHTWLQSTVRAENQLAGFRVGVLAELQRREGAELTDNTLRKTGLRSRSRARSEVETAKALEDLPETSKGLRDGDISYENARILAKASQRGEIDETELGDQARSQSPDRFAGTVRRYEQRRSEDDGVSRLEHQRSRRYARIKTDLADGMTVLSGRFDPITGALLSTALSQKMNELWREEDPRNRRTPGQRMADALKLLITRETKDDEDGRSRGPRLLLIADYDAVSRELRNGRLGDGTPVPVEKIRDLACQSEILPAIFRGASQPLDLGRSRRTASPTQRIALIARDKACIGCGASASWCQAHHVTPWAADGLTNLDEMCLLCSRCHRRVHDDQWQIHRTPTGQYTLRPPPKHQRRTPRLGNRSSYVRYRAKQRK